MTGMKMVEKLGKVPFTIGWQGHDDTQTRVYLQSGREGYTIWNTKYYKN